jgi:hypothetical protein
MFSNDNPPRQIRSGKSVCSRPPKVSIVAEKDAVSGDIKTLNLFDKSLERPDPGTEGPAEKVADLKRDGTHAKKSGKASLKSRPRPASDGVLSPKIGGFPCPHFNDYNHLQDWSNP